MEHHDLNFSMNGFNVDFFWAPEPNNIAKQAIVKFLDLRGLLTKGIVPID
jgi:hypothetical protein